MKSRQFLNKEEKNMEARVTPEIPEAPETPDESRTPNQKPKKSINNAFASKFAKSMFLDVSGMFILSFSDTRMIIHIDLNLYGYVVGTIVYLGGFFYRFISWGERPPTKIFIKKGIKLLFRKSTPQTAVEHLGTFRFIWNGGIYRWPQHILIGGGCVLDCLVAFPLVFGWRYLVMELYVYYTIVVWGVDIMRLKAHGCLSVLSYNALNISSFMVIEAASMAMYRGFKNIQARAEQSYIYDFLPLHLLLFVSVTGLALTFS